MSWSLQLSHGDLVLGTKGLNTATGGTKLTQDLRCALLTSAGSDPLHPSFGSVLDGGVDAQGNTQPGIIGQPNNPAAAAFIQGEIQRICRAYQSQQIARNTADVTVYGKSTLTADEALLGIENIAVQQVVDEALVTATLRTGTGGLPLAIPFTV